MISPGLLRLILAAGLAIDETGGEWYVSGSYSTDLTQGDISPYSSPEAALTSVVRSILALYDGAAAHDETEAEVKRLKLKLAQRGADDPPEPFKKLLG